MLNPASDPFMVNQLRGMANRPRVKVRMISASGLPERGSNKSTYATCMAKNKKSSTFRTRDSMESRAPVWDEPGGQMVMRWVPGDVLMFHILDKDRGSFLPGMLQSETIVAQCEIRSDDYFPSGYQGNLNLTNAAGIPIQGATINLEIQVFGVEGAGVSSKMSKIFNFAQWDLRSMKHALEMAPETIAGYWYQILGEPADDRTKGDLPMLIGVPCVVFCLVTWLGWIVKHYNPMAVTIMEIVVFLIAGGFFVMSVTTHKKSKLPLFPLGCLMLIAVAFSMVFVESGWNNCWRQFWWMHTGTSYGASGSTPAEARSDASVLTFNGVKNGTAWTSVDATRAAGYRNGDIYCAAPILDPTVALGDIMRVEFWAIGINCCDDFGSFTCDASRETAGQVGVVMKGDGMPCAGCNANEFRLAALKAAGVNKMVSAPGALYVRYVSSASTITDLYMSQCIFSVFWSLVFAVLFFGAIGFITNYKGFGKPGRFPLYNLLVPSHKALPPTAAMMEKLREEQKTDPAKQPKMEDVADAPWTLVLSPSTQPGGFNLAAVKNEDAYGATA